MFLRAVLMSVGIAVQFVSPLSADDTPKPALVLKLGVKIGEIRQRIEFLSETVERTADAARKAEFAEVKRKAEETIAAAEKSIDSTAAIADSLVELGGAESELQPGKWTSPISPTPSALPAAQGDIDALLGARPVVAISLEDYIALRTFFPIFEAAARNPEGVNRAVEKLREKYPQGLGKYIQDQQMEAVRRATEIVTEREKARERKSGSEK